MRSITSPFCSNLTPLSRKRREPSPKSCQLRWGWGRDEGDQAEAGEFRRIVVGVDGSASSRRALVWASRFALPTNAEIIAVHALDTPAFVGGEPEMGRSAISEDVHTAWKQWRVDTERILDEDWCMPLRQARVPYRAATVDGGPRGLLGLANHEHADAIVVGVEGEVAWPSLSWAVSHHLVHHSSRPVIVVPHEGD